MQYGANKSAFRVGFSSERDLILIFFMVSVFDDLVDAIEACVFSRVHFKILS